MRKFGSDLKTANFHNNDISALELDLFKHNENGLIVKKIENVWIHECKCFSQKFDGRSSRIEEFKWIDNNFLKSNSD